MNKLLKPLLSLGVIATVLVPTSCSTTWRHWDVNNDDTEHVALLPKPEISEEALWQVRPINELLLAYNTSSKTVDLSLINNQYELQTLIANIVNIATGDLVGVPDIYGNALHEPDGNKDPIDYYWKSGWVDGEYNEFPYRAMREYLETIIQTSNITFKYGSSTDSHSLVWDLTTSIERVVNGSPVTFPSIDEAIQAILDFDGTSDSKGYDVEIAGINENSQPKELSQVTTAADAFMRNPIVATILELDEAFCLRMSKLANLPKTTFDAFNEVLYRVDEEMTKLYESSVFKEFESEKSIDFTISQYDGQKNFYTNKQPVDLFKGIFLLSAIGAE